MNRMKVLATIALAASVLGAHAQTTTNATPDPAGDFVMQGDFADASSNVFLTNNSNRDRVGCGGTIQRMNQPIVGFSLPNIPAGETLQAATFTFQMAADALAGDPLNFEMVVCMLNATDPTDLAASGTSLYTETTAAVNATLNDGIVIGQLAHGNVSDGATMEISLTGAALAQLSGLYNAAGVPSQTHVFFRFSHSTPVVYPAFNNERFQLDDTGGSVVRSLELDWGAPTPVAFATRNGSHAIQGNFEDGVTADVLLLDNGNSKRVGVGGATGTRRVNVPIWGLDLPTIPASTNLTAATLSVDVDLIAGKPLYFEAVASLMNATDVSQFTAADFVEAEAPLDTVLSNGIVFAQIDQARIPDSGTWDIPVTGDALTQLKSLYDASGNPTQTTVWFRLSPSVSTTYAAGEGDRVQFEDDGSGSAAAFDLKLTWAPVPEFTTDPVIKTNTTWGTDYATLSQTLDGSATASDGTSTILYEKAGGPAWLNVATNGALSGIADVIGTNEFPIKATIGDNSASAILQIVVDPLGNPPAFTTNVISKVDGTWGEDYSGLAQTLAGSASDPDFDTLIYSRAGGGPGWLNVASNGALSGVCDVLGTNTFPVQVTDGNGNFDTASLVIVVQSVGSPPEFTVDPITKANAPFGEDYADKFQTLDGSATDPDPGDILSYSLVGSGWLNVASNGALSGVATVVGTNSFTVQVDDGNGNTDTATLLIVVDPLPVGDLIVGIDSFDSGTAPTVTFTDNVSATATASGVGGNWITTDSSTDPGRGSSVDGTWGTHEGPPAASAITNAHGANLTLTNGKTDGEITITVVNTGAEDLELGAFHMDVLAFRPKAARTYALNVLAGSDITEGNVFTSASQAIYSAGGTGPLASRDAHDDIDIDMSGLADNVLEVGGTAIIQIAFSGGTDGSLGHHLFVDNIGISLKGESGPVVPNTPTMTTSVSGGNIVISWATGGEFKLQTRANLAHGNWEDVPGVLSASPITVPMTNNVEFLRLVWP
ncbi:putative Ig domain-containing protein [Pontiellaceae bacterium B12227]|nr:putative Ig domain-containing protein [Pontiellaceae bacterium B12227]